MTIEELVEKFEEEKDNYSNEEDEADEELESARLEGYVAALEDVLEDISNLENPEEDEIFDLMDKIRVEKDEYFCKAATEDVDIEGSSVEREVAYCRGYAMGLDSALDGLYELDELEESRDEI